MNPVSEIADFAAVGAVLGGLAALALGREDRVEKWTAKGAVYGAPPGSRRLSPLLSADRLESVRELIPVAIAIAVGLVLGFVGFDSWIALTVVGVLVVLLLVFGPEGRRGRAASRVTQAGP